MSLDYDRGASMEHPYWLTGWMGQHSPQKEESQQTYYNPRAALSCP
jgi:hypothetical protein